MDNLTERKLGGTMLRRDDNYTAPEVKPSAARKALTDAYAPIQDPDTLVINGREITGWRRKPESEYIEYTRNLARRAYAYWLYTHRTKDGAYIYHPELIVEDRLAELRAILQIDYNYDVAKHIFKPFVM